MQTLTQTIQINGKEYPIKFTYSTLMNLERKLKKTFNEIAAQLANANMTILVEIALAGLKTGARLDGGKFDMKIEALGDILTPESLIEITEIFGESFAPKEVQNDEADLTETEEIKN